MTDTKSLEGQEQLAGTGVESDQAMPAPDYGGLSVESVKRVVEQGTASFKSTFEPSEEMIKLLEKESRPPGRTAQEESKLRSLMPPPPRRLSERQLKGVLNDFVSLHGKSDKFYERFAKRFGFLRLCYRHGLPEGHLPPRWPIDWDIAEPRWPIDPLPPVLSAS